MTWFYPPFQNTDPVVRQIIKNKSYTEELKDDFLALDKKAPISEVSAKIQSLLKANLNLPPENLLDALQLQQEYEKNMQVINKMLALYSEQKK